MDPSSLSPASSADGSALAHEAQAAALRQEIAQLRQFAPAAPTPGEPPESWEAYAALPAADRLALARSRPERVLALSQADRLVQMTAEPEEPAPAEAESAPPPDLPALWEQVEDLRRQVGPAVFDGQSAEGWLTVYQVASRLRVTAAQAQRWLADLPTRHDDRGMLAVSAETFDQFLRDCHAGRPTKRFL